ncbi:MAG: type II toxin-antitoxin system Phd/YefM family antitoxin [Leeuwenhoekiella sp.]
MKTITSTNFRKHMARFLEEVTNSFETIFIPRNNDSDEGVVIMPVSEYNAWKETSYLLQSENNRKRLDSAIDEINSGETIEVAL